MTELRLAMKDEVTAELARISGRLKHPAKLMAGISNELRTITFDNFAREASDGEKWKNLSPVTIALRSKKGHWPGAGKLQVEGKLRNSIGAFSSTTEAGVGASRIYARLQQLGGQAGRGKKVTVPARPYLPMKKGGGGFELTKEARESILELMETFVSKGL